MQKKITVSDYYIKTAKLIQRDMKSLLVNVRYDADICRLVKDSFNIYPSIMISGLNKMFYRWFEAEYVFNEDSTYSPEHIWYSYDMIMKRVLSLELMYIQFIKSHDKHNKEEIKIFILLCNRYLSEHPAYKQNLLISVLETYNIMSNKYDWVTTKQIPAQTDEEFEEYKKTERNEILDFNSKCEYYF